ncbi:hypothetical protein BBD39_10075 [Arsenophonus endosymbiont of Bemisia tabaci Asia II 3]|nr:hypothetical protein BBD39_10075 [Arsenophonus endosymbiont of Bemisia tabaci Asia II 3]
MCCGRNKPDQALWCIMITDPITQESVRPAWQTYDHCDDPIIWTLRNQFSPDAFTIQSTRTGMLVIWIKREQLLAVIEFLKKQPKPYVT